MFQRHGGVFVVGGKMCNWAAFFRGAVVCRSPRCRPLVRLRSPVNPDCHLPALLSTTTLSSTFFSVHRPLRGTTADAMTAVEMEVENGARQAMDTEDVDGSSSGSSSDASGEEGGGGRDAMEGSDEEQEESHANPAFSKFMQGFWDLASVDVPVRVGAAAMIVRHVSSGGDAGYAVKRLVRGMCSSRESARQGFASCLAQVLSVLPEDEPTTAAVLEQILKATQTTSAMKGADERELVLGRLLGVSSLALSGRLGSDQESAEGALKAVAELYTKRKWLGQATGEAALLVTSKAFKGEGEFARTALPLLVPLLKGKDGSSLQVPDLSPDQLLLSLGLRSIMRERGLDPQEDVALKQALPSFLRHASIVRVGKAQDLVPALKQSALAFPKVHSVWGRLWDDIGLSPAGQPRAALSAKRLKKLAEVWSAVVDGGLTNASLNSKGTAVLLLKQVLARVPAAGVWHVLSPGIVRLLLNHTKGEENYLFSLVRMTLEQLPKTVGDDEEVQAQVAASFLRRGTIRFDSLAGVPVVSSLVKGMGQEALNAHVEFLKGVVQGQAGWTDRQDSTSGESVKKEANGAATQSAETPAAETPDETDETVQGKVAERAQAVEALYSLARSGGGGGSGGKKGGDARSAALAALKAGGAQAHGVRLKSTAEFFLEAGFFAPAGGAVALPAKLSELCRSKFFSVVADIAAKPLFWQANAGDANSSNTATSSKKKGNKSAGEGPASGALEALWGLHEAWQGLEKGGGKFVKGVTVGLDEREACSVALGVVGRIRTGASSGDKLGSAFAGILLMVSLHLLEGSKGDSRGGERCQHIFDLVETYGRISGKGEGGDDMGDDDDDDEEDKDATDPDPLSMLADVLVAVVAEPSAHSVRGLRDTARRVWGMVCGARPLTKSALETLLAAVCGGEEGNVPEDGGESSSEEEEEEEEDDGDGDASAKSEESSDDDDDAMKQEEEEEVTLDPSDLEELLKGNDGSDDEGGLQHHAGADAALGALLGLKKSGRKKGTLEAQRQGYQIRLRALDLLEVVCSRRQDSRYLLGALLPVLNAIKKLDGSAVVGSRTGGEASALSKRLQALYSQRLCKCKPRLDEAETGDDTEDFPSQTAEAFSQLMGLCKSWEKDAPLASLALEGALCCLKSLKGRPSSGKGKGKKGGGGGVEALDGALKALAAAVGDFFGKKRGGGLTSLQVEEVMRRFPDILVPVLVDAAGGAAASDFLRTEAFRLLSGVLQRRGSMDPVSRKALLAHCPAIFKALGDVISTTAAGAATAAAAAAAAAEATAEATAAAEATTVEATPEASKADSNSSDTPTKKKKTPKKAASASSSSSTMLKAKRLKPLLACLTNTLQADEGVGSLTGMNAEAQALRTALEAVGEASASLPMQLLCGEVAQGLDIFGAVEEGQKKKKKSKDKASPKVKRKAAAAVDESVAADSPAPAGRGKGGGGEGDAEEVAPKSSGKKKKRRRESKDGQEG